MVCSMAVKIANTLHNSGVKMAKPDSGFNSNQLEEALANTECKDERAQIRRGLIGKNSVDFRGMTLQEIHATLSATGVINSLKADHRITLGQDMQWLRENSPAVYRDIRGQHGNIYKKFGIEVQWGNGVNIGIMENNPQNIRGNQLRSQFMSDIITEFHRTGQCGCCEPGSWRRDPVTGDWTKNLGNL